MFILHFILWFLEKGSFYVAQAGLRSWSSCLRFPNVSYNILNVFYGGKAYTYTWDSFSVWPKTHMQSQLPSSLQPSSCLCLLSSRTTKYATLSYVFWMLWGTHDRSMGEKISGFRMLPSALIHKYQGDTSGKDSAELRSTICTGTNVWDTTKP